MNKSLDQIKLGIKQIERGLEKTVYAAAKEVRSLGTPCAEEYEAAILNQNGYGTDTAQIYFYRYASEDFPVPSDGAEFQIFMQDSERKKKYDNVCFNGWKSEVTKVENILNKYKGNMEVEDKPLREYLNGVKKANVTPDWRIRVRVYFPGQEIVRLVTELKEAVKEYESGSRE